jgi:hypothetical protein
MTAGLTRWRPSSASDAVYTNSPRGAPFRATPPDDRLEDDDDPGLLLEPDEPPDDEELEELEDELEEALEEELVDELELEDEEDDEDEALAADELLDVDGSIALGSAGFAESQPTSTTPLDNRYRNARRSIRSPTRRPPAPTMPSRQAAARRRGSTCRSA